MKKMNKKGFTLAELLIVVAIIAVLVAIAIPVFSSQLEKSREATDLANIRSAYAEVVVEAIEGTTVTKTVTLKQQADGWASGSTADTDLKNICGDASYVTGTPKKGGTATLTWVAEATSGSTTTPAHCTIAFSS